MKRIWAALAAGALALGLAAQPAQAQFAQTEATAVRDDFVLPPGEVRVLVFRPDVSVGEQTTGGMNQPSADWTEAARGHIVTALRKAQAARGSQLVEVPDNLPPEQAALVADYSALFRTVASSAMQHKLFPGDRLPTKQDRFDWTLGEEASRLTPLGGDFGLFLFTHDSYGSTGRKAAQIVGLLLGVGMIPSGVHIGYAGLVDLRNGDLVWLNVDVQMGGDVRTAEGAEKRVAQLLEEFPIKGKGDVLFGEAPAEKTAGEPKP